MQFITGEEVERRSMAIIEREVGNHPFDAQQWPLVRRMVHASADFSIIEHLRFAGQPVEHGIAALTAGAPIVTDSTMMLSGISKARLAALNPAYADGNIFCNIADPQVAKLASANGLPRSIYNMRSLKTQIQGGIVGIGNAPTALWEVCRQVQEENVRPALLVAMPVGFVNVVESKAIVKSLDIPYILMDGRRGGTPFVVATLNALIIAALDRNS
jgi:precorrin isomerase